MSAYTPGPWHVGMKPGPSVYGPLGELVVPLNVMLDAPEVTANARLIAQAPAMADALREVAAFLRYVPGVHPTALADRVESILATIEGK